MIKVKRKKPITEKSILDIENDIKEICLQAKGM